MNKLHIFLFIAGITLCLQSKFVIRQLGDYSRNTQLHSNNIESFKLPGVSGRTWNDYNRNGKQDEGEPGIPSLRVQIKGTDIFGDQVDRTTTTDMDGKYGFTELIAGTYAVSFKNDAETGYSFTIPNVEGDKMNDLDSDPNLDGATATFKLAESLNHLDAGLFADKDHDYLPNDIDPQPSQFNGSGIFYCSNGINKGDIVPGGHLDIEGPGEVLWIKQPNTGTYHFLVTTTGTYKITVIPPGNMRINPSCPFNEELYDLTEGINTPGQDVINGKLTDGSCNANPFYAKLYLQPGDFLINHHIPVDCLCSDEEIKVQVKESFPTAAQSTTPAGVTPPNTNGSAILIKSGKQISNTVFNLPENICEVNLPYDLEISDLSCISQEEALEVTITSADGKYFIMPDLNNLAPGKWQFLANGLTAAASANPYMVKIELKDQEILLYQESFKITVRETISDDWATCRSSVSVLLDANCESHLDPRDVFIRTGCFTQENFYVQVVYPGKGRSINKVTYPGTFNFVVNKVVGQPDWTPDGLPTGDNQPDLEHCQGKVNAVDNIAPTICIANVVGLKRTLATKTTADLVEGVAELISGKYYQYEPVSFDAKTCTNDGINLHLTEASLGSGDVFLFSCSDADYIFNNKASWNDPTYAFYTGLAYAEDNCSNTKLSFVRDQLIDEGCDYLKTPNGGPQYIGGQPVIKVIERTFGFKDEAGNESTTIQLIYFTRPLVYLPDCTVSLNICEFEEVGLAKPELIESFPFYYNALGDQLDLTDNACHLTSAIEDQVFELENNCGYKISRTWTIKDWCSDGFLNLENLAFVPEAVTECDFNEVVEIKNNKLTFEQNVYIRDEKVPTVEIPEKFGKFSIGPFNCEASFNVPNPIVENECDYLWTVEIWEEASKIFLGVETGERDTVIFNTANIIVDNDIVNYETKRVIATGIPKGHFFFKYIINDKCGNRGFSQLIPFQVIDGIEPIVKCDDDLVVAIGQGLDEDGNQYGFTRVTAEDVDENSADNCSPEVLKEVRRFIPEENLEDFLNGTTDFKLAELIADKDPFSTTEGYWTPWHPYADFTCADVNQVITITLRVWDDGDSDGIYGESGQDNSNTCMMRVLVQDKLAPVCVAPEDIELYCDETSTKVNIPEGYTKWSELEENEQEAFLKWFEELEKANKTSALFTDNCNATIEMSEAIFDIKCGAGTITRYFSVVDQFGNESSNNCYHTIYLKRKHDYCIQFPKDIEVSCAEALDTTILNISTEACDLIAVSINDEKFEVIDGSSGCFKVFRTYRAINWCQFDAEVNQRESVFDESFHILPMVISRDEDGNGIQGDQDIYVHFEGREKTPGNFEGTTYIDANCIYNDKIPKVNNGYWRKENYLKGFYQYTQILKVKDNEAPSIETSVLEAFPSNQISSSNNNCSGDVEIPIEVSEDCNIKLVTISEIKAIIDAENTAQSTVVFKNGKTTLSARDFDFDVVEGEPLTENSREFILAGTFPIGSHELEISVTDACGNSAVKSIPFEVVDVLAPSPICFPNLSVSLSAVDLDGNGKPDDNVGLVSVWAQDFVKTVGTPEDCSGEITYSIHRTDAIDGGRELPNETTTNLLVSCDDAPYVAIYIYAWDEAGNADRCQTSVLINDFSGLCNDTPVSEGLVAVSGIIATEKSLPVSDVHINLSGARNMGENTGDAGNYAFKNLPAYEDYTLQPSKKGDDKNGVSTFDIITITKHILGIQKLVSPYKMIAADVNQSKSITTLDIIQMRKLILGVETKFSSSESWRFIDAAYNFPDPANPWKETFPEVINFNDLKSNESKGNFMAIKVGDVSGDVATNSKVADTRQNIGNFVIHANNFKLAPGQIEHIVFTSEMLEKVSGFQFTLQVDPAVRINAILPHQISMNQFGLQQIDAGIITVSWDKYSNPLQEGDLLFELELQSVSAINASEALKINSRITTAEAYDTNAENSSIMDIQLAFKAFGNPAAGYDLLQNYPNPFASNTVIGFVLPAKERATIRIHDMNGKVIWSHSNTYDAGNHEVMIRTEDIKASGVLYYSLETPDFTATKRMVVMK